MSNFVISVQPTNPEPNPSARSNVGQITVISTWIPVLFVSAASNAGMPLTLMLEFQGLGPEVGAVFFVKGFEVMAFGCLHFIPKSNTPNL